MPTFNNVSVTCSIDLDFEVFCDCGAHLCSETTTRNSRGRNAPQAVVNACKACIESAKEPLQERIEELEQLLAEAREQNNS